MNNTKVKEIKYIGIEKPSTVLEIEVEVSGLEHAISQANELISRLKQALKIAKLENEGKNG